MNIFITGDSKGLGYFLCNYFSKNGHVVYGVSRNTPPDCSWNHINMDLGSIKKDKIIPFLTECDILINNAAIASDNLAVVETENNVENLYKINVISPINITKIWAKERIRQRKGGVVLFVSSICSKRSYKGLSIYGSTKAAINHFSNVFAKEMASRNIRSNCIIPGYMETDMNSSLNEETKKKIKSNNPMKRFLNFEEISSVINFIISDKNSYMNGAEIILDGGYTL